MHYHILMLTPGGEQRPSTTPPIPTLPLAVVGFNTAIDTFTEKDYRLTHLRLRVDGTPEVLLTNAASSPRLVFIMLQKQATKLDCGDCRLLAVQAADAMVAAIEANEANSAVSQTPNPRIKEIA